MAGEFQSQFQEAMREAEMADLKKQVDELSDVTKGFTARSASTDLQGVDQWEPKTDTAADGAVRGDACRRQRRLPTAEPAGSGGRRRACARCERGRAGSPSAGTNPAATAAPAEPMAEGSGRA